VATSKLTKEEWREAHHYFHHDDKMTDLAAIRDEAQQRAFDKRDPEDSVIHFHPYDENGDGCKNIIHEQYRKGEGLVSGG
jgi:hypothetical protein